MALFSFFLLVTTISMVAARQMAVSRGRPAQTWMMAAALFGPLPLIPLAALRRR
jgi:hypothetical protein